MENPRQKQYDAMYNLPSLETVSIRRLIGVPKRDVNKLVEYINLNDFTQIHKSFSFCDLCSAPYCSGCDIYDRYPKVHKRPMGLRRLGFEFILPLYEPYGFTENQTKLLYNYLLKHSVRYTPSIIVDLRSRRVGEGGFYHECDIQRPPRPLWSKIREFILKRDAHTCVICERDAEDIWGRLEIHHIDGLVINNIPSNLVTLCSSHNHSHAAYNPLTQMKIAQYFETRGAYV